MRWTPASRRQERLLDEQLADMPRQEDDSLEVRLALLCRRCPRCGAFVWREPGRRYCSLCWWARYEDGR